MVGSGGSERDRGLRRLLSETSSGACVASFVCPSSGRSTRESPGLCVDQDEKSVSWDHKDSLAFWQRVSFSFRKLLPRAAPVTPSRGRVGEEVAHPPFPTAPSAAPLPSPQGPDRPQTGPGRRVGVYGAGRERLLGPTRGQCCAHSPRSPRSQHGARVHTARASGVAQGSPRAQTTPTPRR